MLVLTRQKKQSIMIGNNIEIMIVNIGGNKVRVGIVAPQSTAVYRKEIYEAIGREKFRRKNSA